MDDERDAVGNLERVWELMNDYLRTLYGAAACLRVADGHEMTGVWPGDDRPGCVSVETVDGLQQSFALTDYDYSGVGKLWDFDWPEDSQRRWFETLQDAYDAWAAEL